MKAVRLAMTHHLQDFFRMGVSGRSLRDHPHSMRAVLVSRWRRSRDSRTYSARPAEIAALIRRAREDRGLTQAELAELMGSKQSTVARWERGEHDFKAQTLLRFAAALQVEIVVHFDPQEVSR